MEIGGWLQFILTITVSVLGSAGFWAFISKRSDRNNAARRMLTGLAHDRIMSLGTSYIERGWVTVDEYENLDHYLYQPYKDLGGNGTAKRIMEKVKELPIRK